MLSELGPTWPGGPCLWTAMSQVLMADGCKAMELGLPLSLGCIEPSLLFFVHDPPVEFNADFCYQDNLLQQILGSAMVDAV